MLKQRIITAICIFALFLITLLSASPVIFTAFVGLVLMVSAWEWSNLSGFKYYWQRILYALIFLVLLAAASLYLGILSEASIDNHKARSLFLSSGLWWAIALLWVQGYPSSAVLWGSRWVRAIIGLLVLIPGGVSLVFLHGQPQGHWLILLVVLIVATADTGAYFAGKAFGRRKLAKNVSPGKSWEGVWGGLISCILLALLVALVTGWSAWTTLLAIIVPTALVSVLGDLLESMVKRHRGLKDSGYILPGHGGVMDRIDGLTAAAPIFALAIILSGWQLPS